MNDVNKADMVRQLMMACLYKSEEIEDDKHPDDAVIVVGIMNKFGFHPGRLKENRAKIKWLLDEMPDSFHRAKGGGWSFLNLCMDKHNTHWAEHRTMGDLIALAIGSKMGGYCLPREHWKSFPGGMPYVWFDTKGSE